MIRAPWRRLGPWAVLLLVLGWSLGAAGAQHEGDVAPGYRWPGCRVERERLPAALPAEVLPERFEALVGEIDPPRAGRTPTVRWCGHGTSAERSRFWPASTIKLFAAIGLLEWLGEHGLPPEARLRFMWPARPERGLPPRPGQEPLAEPLRPAETIEVSAASLVRRAIVRSDNRAYDLLVTFVGFRWLHERLLVPARGFRRTVLQRGYGRFVLEASGQHGTLRYAPPRSVSWGGRRIELPAQWAAPVADCPEEGTCTTLLELATAMARLALHEELPPAERFRLGPAHLHLLRSALAARKPRGNGVVDGLRRGFGSQGESLRVLHKPGYAYRWFSDVVFLEAPGGRRWVVAMAGWPGRAALDRVAEALGRRLATGWRCAPGGAVDGGGPRGVSDPSSGARPGSGSES